MVTGQLGDDLYKLLSALHCRHVHAACVTYITFNCNNTNAFGACLFSVLLREIWTERGRHSKKTVDARQSNHSVNIFFGI